MAKSSLPILTDEELTVFCWQLGMTLETGMDLRTCMREMHGMFEDQERTARFNLLCEKLDEGAPLEEAFETSGLFPTYLTRMVKIGSMSGHQDTVFLRLSDHYAQQADIKAAIKNAVIYPTALLVIIALITLVTITYAFPVFRHAYAGLGAEMSASLTGWMRAGTVLGIVVLACVVIAIALLISVLILQRKGKLNDVLEKFPAMSRLYRAISAWRYTDVLSTLLSAAVPTDEAIRQASDVAEKDWIVEDRNDMSIAEALDKSGLLEPFDLRLLRAGTAAGNEEASLRKIAGLCRERFEDHLGHMLGVLEPVLVSVLSVVIGCIMLSVVLPLIGILAALI